MFEAQPCASIDDQPDNGNGARSKIVSGGISLSVKGVGKGEGIRIQGEGVRVKARRVWERGVSEEDGAVLERMSVFFAVWYEAEQSRRQLI